MDAGRKFDSLKVKNVNRRRVVVDLYMILSQNMSLMLNPYLSAIKESIMVISFH